jgi:general secretion pathway protein C
MMLAALFLVTSLSTAPREIVLKGYVLARDESRSVAVLLSGGRTRVVRVGETAFGGRLVSVAPEGTTLEFGTERVTLRLQALESPSLPASPAAGAPEPSTDPETPPRAMARADVDRRLGLEMNRILAETALMPVMEEGRVTGVALTRIAAGSLLTEAGLRTGDVLTEINGTKIDGLAALMGLYGRLQGEKELRAVVLRGGRSISLKVTLQ